MRKRWRVIVAGVLVILIVVGGYAVVRLSRAGYLPRRATLTAEPAPTTVPLDTVLPATATETVAATEVPPTEVTPTEVVAAATVTPEPEAESTATSEPAAQPTEVVAPPESLALPEGFGASVFAQGLSGPRMMAVGPDGHVYVAERGAGRIVRLPDRDANGLADGVEVVASGLSSPSSLAFYEDGSLYVGETTRVLRITLNGDPPAADATEVIVDGLPSGGHNTRTVLFSPDWAWLYVSVGSSCNVCVEEDPRRAAIVRYRPDGSEETTYAEGLRNAVGITFRPGTDELWATNNGRDWLGDDQPPETLYVVREGDDAGFPRCHSGRIIDPDYGSAGDCDGVLVPAVEMQAHSAPLGLGFYTGTQFPEAYRGDLYVAFHGSWNRTEATGYSVVRVPLDGDNVGPVTDFVAGWLRADGSQWGRPVDVVTASDGSMLISDDGVGRIYRIFYAGP